MDRENSTVFGRAGDSTISLNRISTSHGTDSSIGFNDDVPALRQAIQMQPDVLVCPSNEFRGPHPDQYPFNTTGGDGVENGPATVAVTCYKGNAGDGSFEPIPRTTAARFLDVSADLSTATNGVDCFGIFWRYTYYRGGVKLREVTDGTSKTLLVGEASPEDGNSAAWSSDGDWATRACLSIGTGRRPVDVWMRAAARTLANDRAGR